MRILDEDNDKPIKHILLLLTIDETRELSENLADALTRTSEGYHFHVEDENFKHQITCAIHTGDTFHTFSQRVQRLISDDT